jgi:hypothetical protein
MVEKNPVTKGQNVWLIHLTAPDRRLQSAAFGAGMRGEACKHSFWLSKRVSPESAAAEPQAVRRM